MAILSLSRAVASAAFANAILNVVKLRSHEKMAWPEACSVVAPMTYLQLLRHRSNEQYVRNSVNDLLPAVETNLSVTDIAKTKWPLPAFIVCVGVVRIVIILNIIQAATAVRSGAVGTAKAVLATRGFVVNCEPHCSQVMVILECVTRTSILWCHWAGPFTRSLPFIHNIMQVKTATVDSLNLPRLDLYKIDIDGGEMEALLGAKETIARFRPFLYVENDKLATHYPDLVRWLIEDAGYKLWQHFAPLYNPENFAGYKVNVFGKIVSAMLLCVPKERMLDQAIIDRHGLQRVRAKKVPA